MRLTMVAPSFNDFVVKESHVKTLQKAIYLKLSGLYGI